jgi:hypothetical protein
MSRTLPGENNPIEELSGRLSVSGGFSRLQAELLAEVAAWWQGRRERGAGSLASGVAAHLALPHLRAYWPGSSLDENGALYDLSGQGRRLAAMGSSLPDAVVVGRSGAVSLSRRDGQYFRRAHEAGLSAGAALSLGAWVRCSGAALSATLMGKMGPAGSYSFALVLHALAEAEATWRFYHSEDGSALSYNEKAVAQPAGWHHMAATFSPGEPLLYVDGVRIAAATGKPEALAANGEPFTVGWAAFNPINTLDAVIAHAFVCGYALHMDHVGELYAATRYLFGV